MNHPAEVDPPYAGRCIECGARHEVKGDERCQCGGEITPIHPTEVGAPTGKFRWGGILSFEVGMSEDGHEEIKTVYALRVSGHYYREVRLEESDREDISVIGAESGAFSLVGVTGFMDPIEDTSHLDGARKAIYATEYGTRWASLDLLENIEDEPPTQKFDSRKYTQRLESDPDDSKPDE